MSSRSSERTGPAPRLLWAIAISVAAHGVGMALVQARPARVVDSERSQLQVQLQPAAPALVEAKPAAAPKPAPQAAPQPTMTGPSVAKHYYKPSELDVKPGIMVHVEPHYPERAAQDAVSGRVVAQLFLREDGTVEQVSILRAEPAGYFEYSVEQAFGAARFTPGMKDGQPVKVRMALEVSFGDEK